MLSTRYLQSTFFVLLTGINFLFFGVVNAQQSGSPIELVSTGAAGSANDRIARLWSNEVARDKEYDSSVSNRPGGYGLKAMRYFAESSAPENTLLVTSSVSPFSIGQKRLAEYKVDSSQFIPVCQLGYSVPLMWANADEETSSFIESKKWKENKLRVAGSWKLNAVLGQHAIEQIGISTEIVENLDSVSTALQSGLADIVVASSADMQDSFGAGDVVPIATFSPGGDQFSEGIPTMSELGVEFGSYVNPINIWAHKESSKKTLEYYTQICNKVSESVLWADFAKKADVVSQYHIGDDLGTGPEQAPSGGGCDNSCCNKDKKTCCSSCLLLPEAGNSSSPILDQLFK